MTCISFSPWIMCVDETEAGGGRIHPTTLNPYPNVLWKIIRPMNHQSFFFFFFFSPHTGLFVNISNLCSSPLPPHAPYPPASEVSPVQSLYTFCPHENKYCFCLPFLYVILNAGQGDEFVWCFVIYLFIYQLNSLQKL